MWSESTTSSTVILYRESKWIVIPMLTVDVPAFSHHISIW